MITMFIYLLNAFTYLLPLLFFLPFKMTFSQKATLYFIILTNIILMVYYIGNIGVILLIFSVSIYLLFIDSNRSRNICIFFASYLFCVLYDNLFTIIWNNIGYPITDVLKNNIALYIGYTLIYTLLLFFICKMISVILKKTILNIKLPGEVWISISINLIVCLVIFIFNIVMGEHVGYSKKIIMFNCILFGFYLVVSTISTINSIKGYIVKSNVKFKQESYDTLQKYTQQIENMYSDIRSFKHDYINIMASMSGYIEANDMSGLSNYFKKSILPLSSQISKSNYKLNQLMNIKIVEIKSILSAKLIYAHEIGIDINIEIIEPISTVSMDTMDLARVLGIFMDNAIEASLETSHPELSLVMINNENSIAIIIMNNHIKHDIPYYDLKKISVSTKGKNRGIGLHNADIIISKYPNVIHDTEIKDDLFIQHLEIKKGD